MTNDVQYTTVDLNSTGTTTVYDPDHDATVQGVYMDHGGGTAEVQLEVTDGTDTAVVRTPGAGTALEFGDDLALDGGQSLQINVTTAEGSALSETAGVSVGGS